MATRRPMQLIALRKCVVHNRTQNWLCHSTCSARGGTTKASVQSCQSAQPFPRQAREAANAAEAAAQAAWATPESTLSRDVRNEASFATRNLDLGLSSSIAHHCAAFCLSPWHRVKLMSPKRPNHSCDRLQRQLMQLDPEDPAPGAPGS